MKILLDIAQSIGLLFLLFLGILAVLPSDSDKTP